MQNSKTIHPPNKYPELLNQTTMKLVEELIYRLKEGREKTLDICPREFVDLKITIGDIQYEN